MEESFSNLLLVPLKVTKHKIFPHKLTGSISDNQLLNGL